MDCFAVNYRRKHHGKTTNIGITIRERAAAKLQSAESIRNISQCLQQSVKQITGLVALLNLSLDA